MAEALHYELLGFDEEILKVEEHAAAPVVAENSSTQLLLQLSSVAVHTSAWAAPWR